MQKVLFEPPRTLRAQRNAKGPYIKQLSFLSFLGAFAVQILFLHL